MKTYKCFLCLLFSCWSCTFVLKWSPNHNERNKNSNEVFAFYISFHNWLYYQYTSFQNQWCLDIISKSFIGFFKEYAYIPCMLYLFKLFSNCIFKVTLVLMIHILYAHTNKYLFLYVFLLSQWRYIGAPKIYVYREKENFCEWRKVGFLF